MFLKMAVKKGIGHVELARLPLAGGGYGEHSVDRRGLDDRRKGFTEVDARAMCKPAVTPDFKDKIG